MYFVKFQRSLRVSTYRGQRTLKYKQPGNHGWCLCFIKRGSPGLRILPWSHGESVSVWMWRWCNYTTKSCFLSRANLKEYEVIHYVFVLAIAMAWASTGGLQSCVSIQGTKDHQPASKVVTWFNPAMAKEVLQLFDISVPTGSRKNKTHNFWRISLS